MSGERVSLSISLRLAVQFLHVKYIKDKRYWYLILYLTYRGEVDVPW